MPAIPSQFAELDGLTRMELDRLLEDELEFMSLVHKLDTFQNIQDIRNEKLSENVDTAKANLENETKLKTATQEVKQLQESLKAKVAVFQKLEEQQNILCAPPDQRTTIKQLNKASRQAMDESEEVAADWVENGGNVDTFVKKFLELRKVHHTRAAKAELLQHHNRKEI